MSLRAHAARPAVLIALLAFTACSREDGVTPVDAGDAAVDLSRPDLGPCCEDTDVDSLCDSDEGRADIDRDGLPNREDLDSDGDGLSDHLEAGRDELCAAPADYNDDGIPDYLDPDYPVRDAGAPDLGPDVDGGMDASVDMDVDSGPVVPELCPASMKVPEGCVDETSEGSSGLCDGADNDCDGVVDEDCACVAGSVQRCFRGAVGRRNVGACSDGTQTCESLGEFGGRWGPCLGGTTPRPESCDELDNDCNGCTDEVMGCVPVGSCPGPTDPRVPDGRPFSRYELHGADFYFGADAIGWHWDVSGTPCDRMFQAIPGSTATDSNGQLSYQVIDGTLENAAINFTLSGDYEVTLTVDRADGSTFTCTWVVHVRAPGLRIEACWDQTGPTASDPMDIDLHLGLVGTSTRWFTPSECYFSNCKAGATRPMWFYPDTPIANCTGPGSRGGFTGSCPNPRLDIDNISETRAYVPENANVDNPRDGDTFRVMVHHWDGVDTATRPLVNVYCGGELHGSFGAAPDFVDDFDEGGGSGGGSMWRVGDITMTVDGTGRTTGCTIAPIDPPLMSSGYAITTDDSTF